MSAAEAKHIAADQVEARLGHDFSVADAQKPVSESLVLRGEDGSLNGLQAVGLWRGVIKERLSAGFCARCTMLMLGQQHVAQGARGAAGEVLDVVAQHVLVAGLDGDGIADHFV